MPGYGDPTEFEYPARLLTLLAVVALPVALVVVGVLLDLVIAGAGFTIVVTSETLLPSTVGLIVVFPVTIVLHELCHGLVANLLGYRVTYGTTRIGGYLPVAYAAAFDQPMSRRDSAISAAAPLVVITALGTALAAVSPDWLLFALAVGMLTNLVGAVGDVYILYVTARLPRGAIYYDVSIDEQYIYEPQGG